MENSLGRSGTWRVLELGEEIQKKKGKKEIKEKSGYVCGLEKKREKKKEKKEENAVSEWRRKKMKKKEILSQYFHNKY